MSEAEMAEVPQHKIMSQGPDSILRRMQDVETQSIVSDVILKGIWQNPQTFPNAFQDFTAYSVNIVDELTALKSDVAAKVEIRNNEEQKRANGIKRVSITLAKLQTYFEGLVVLLFQYYLQLGEAKELLLQTGNEAYLPTVNSSTEKVIALLGEVVNASFIVERMSSQVIRKTKGEGTIDVVVTILIGEKLNVHMNPPELTTSIVSEKNKREPVKDGVKRMEWNKATKRLSVTFEKMQLKELKKDDNSKKEKLVMEEKFFLHFCGVITIGSENLQLPLTFKVSALSMPFVWSSHGTQDAVATATIVGYNSFGNNTDSTVRWSDIVELLNAKVVKLTGRELAHKHRISLAKMAFRDKNPQPDKISWSELYKAKLPHKTFTFWTWFHAILKVLGKKKEFKELFREGFIELLDQESAEELVSSCEEGTFVLRPSGSDLGTFSASAIVDLGDGGPYKIVNLPPKDLQDLLNSILNTKSLKDVLQGERCIPKADAFKLVCAQANAPAAQIRKGYCLMQSNISLGSICNTDAIQQLPSIRRPKEPSPPTPFNSQPPSFEPPQVSPAYHDMRAMEVPAYATFHMEASFNTLESPDIAGPSYTAGGSPASGSAFRPLDTLNHQVFEPPFYQYGRLATFDLAGSSNWGDSMEISDF